MKVWDLWGLGPQATGLRVPGSAPEISLASGQKNLGGYRGSESC